MASSDLIAQLLDARARTLELVDDLSDAQWMGPKLRIVNPLLWEVGHVAWFQELWVLRRARGLARPSHDALYDSSHVPHDTRWTLPLLDRAQVHGYLEDVLGTVIDGLRAGPISDEERYFVLLSLFHEDMHDEAFAMTRQTLGYPAPRVHRPSARTFSEANSGPSASDARVPGGVIRLGVERSERGFFFDNEKWAHDVVVEPFAMAKRPVTQAEFAAFVDDGGYTQRELWSEEGWAWRVSAEANVPVYWRREDGRWRRRSFDTWRDVEPELPMFHVSWFEADAYCRWAKRRLPTEAEWERAATFEPADLAARRHQPWGDAAADASRANLDAAEAGPVPVDACAGGDSALGIRQLIGNVWEWTSTTFEPFPGFSVDPYEDYSRPWFGNHKVMKGGSYLTRSRMIRPGYRNFYTPDRRDVFAGFRTCAP